MKIQLLNIGIMDGHDDFVFDYSENLIWGSDRTIAESAWASTNASQNNQRSVEDVNRVTTQVVVEHHDTPKESVWFRFYLYIPIFIERQLDKYRMTLQKQDYEINYLVGDVGRFGITQNEFSGRYRTLIHHFLKMPDDIKQIIMLSNCEHIESEYYHKMESNWETYSKWLKLIKDAYNEHCITNADYKRFREFARGVLGTGFYTAMQWSLNLNALEHILNQRLAAETQRDTQIVAYMMYREINRIADQTNFKNTWSKMKLANGWIDLVEKIELTVLPNYQHILESL